MTYDLYIDEKSSYQIFFIPHNFILYLFSRSIKLPLTMFLSYFSAILTTHVLHIWSILGTFLKKNAVCVCWRAEAQWGIKHFKRTKTALSLNMLVANRSLMKNFDLAMVINHLQELIHRYLTLDFTSIFMKTVLLSTN